MSWNDSGISYELVDPDRRPCLGGDRLLAVYVTSEKWSPFDDPDDTSYSLILLIIAILLIGTFLAVII